MVISKACHDPSGHFGADGKNVKFHGNLTKIKRLFYAFVQDFTINPFKNWQKFVMLVQFNYHHGAINDH